jgi:PAS domain S-box-containing protein
MSVDKKSGNDRTEVLIVEDSATQAEELKNILEKNDYAVSSAGDGEEALAVMRQHKPDIVISDVVMPKMDGYEMCKQIKKDKSLKNIPIILLTALFDTLDVIRGLECGADNFITKPYDEKYLLSRLRFIEANKKVQEMEKTRIGLIIVFAGRKYFITSNRLQILNLLLSTYEAAVQKNQGLSRLQDELKKLNEELEHRVKERTDELRIENEERKRAENALKASEEKYRIVVENANEAIAVVQDERTIFANNRAMDLSGYSMEELSSKKFMDLFHPEDRDILVERYKERLKGKKGNGISSYRFIVKGGRLRWVETSSVAITWENRPAVLFFISDITERIRSEEEKKKSAEKLMEAMRATVEAIAMTTEIRDPYTAGHQRRVANITRAIGEKMGLSKDRIEGLFVAGVIHDIGKIYVPAEILSKPGRLNKSEFDLIKMHPKAAVDILKNIKFPWPVTTAIFQHHERINGSGYPLGLANGKICLEAKVLAVADVMEAIVSHRPYRPALSMDKAREEIVTKKGVLYDPDVVDACLRVMDINTSIFS